MSVLKKGDLIWSAILIFIISFLVLSNFRELFKEMTRAYPYIMGFIKFAILATMGELLVLRLVNGRWKIVNGIFYKVIIWGFLGIGITLIFELFNSGVAVAEKKGMLPGNADGFTLAFLTSLLMNITFAPTMMAFHRITNTYIDLIYQKKNDQLNIRYVVNSIDWGEFVSFVVLKTIPLFWIPVHTIVFLLPNVYRVISAAFLSMALGVLLTFAGKK